MGSATTPTDKVPPTLFGAGPPLPSRPQRRRPQPERKLGQVIEAYQTLKRRRAFA